MLNRDSMVFESIRLLAVISVALCLIPAGAHFFELANKMSLSTPEYMTTQKIYAGWSFFGVAIIAAIVLTLMHTLMVRAERAAFLLSLAAFACLGATQVISDRGHTLLRSELAFNFQIEYLASVPADAQTAPETSRFLRNRHRKGGLLSNDGEKHHDLC